MLQTEAAPHSHLPFPVVSFTWSLRFEHLMCTSQAGIGHFMYTSLGLDWSFDVFPHMLFILHSRATKQKGSKRGIAAAAQMKKKRGDWGAPGAIWMRTYNTAARTATGKRTGRDITCAAPYVRAALCDVRQCTMRGRGHESRLWLYGVFSCGRCKEKMLKCID